MRAMTRPPRTYELMTILAPDVPEDQIGPAVEQIKNYISGAGGAISEVLQDSPWGRRRLAYPIRHNGHDVRDGYYTVFHFDLEPGRVADIEREILLNDQIIRYLVTVYTAPAPSPEAEQTGEEEKAAEPAGTTTAEAEPEPAAESASTDEATAQAPETATNEATADVAEATDEAPAATEAAASTGDENADEDAANANAEPEE